MLLKIILINIKNIELLKRIISPIFSVLFLHYVCGHIWRIVVIYNRKRTNMASCL